MPDGFHEAEAMASQAVHEIPQVSNWKEVKNHGDL